MCCHLIQFHLKGCVSGRHCKFNETFRVASTYRCKKTVKLHYSFCGYMCTAGCMQQRINGSGVLCRQKEEASLGVANTAFLRATLSGSERRGGCGRWRSCYRQGDIPKYCSLGKLATPVEEAVFTGTGFRLHAPAIRSAPASLAETAVLYLSPQRKILRYVHFIIDRDCYCLVNVTAIEGRRRTEVSSVT